MTFALVLVPAVLLVLGFPIFVVLLTGVTLALVLFMDVPLAALHQNLFAGVNAYALLAIPFFIYAGELMTRSSVGLRLVDFVDAAVGPLRGSRGLTTIGASVIFGAISGASAATIGTVGKVMYPALVKSGYPAVAAAGLVTAVGAIDIIIPPSIPMIVYAMAASESVARLYVAGVVPGLLIAVLLSGYVLLYASRAGIAKGEPFRRALLLTAVKRAGWALGAPLVILGGIYGGVFSPTEAAAVACAYAVFVACAVYRELGWNDILDAAGASVIFTSQILIIVACANVFAWVLTVNQVPAAIVSWFDAMQLPHWLLLLAINLLLLAVGCVLDPTSAIVMLTPLLLPLAKAMGLDPVHFGIMVMVNIAVGLFSPPFGINIFAAQSVLGLPAGVIYRGILPFLAVYLVALALIAYVPAISLVGVTLLFPN